MTHGHGGVHSKGYWVTQGHKEALRGRVHRFRDAASSSAEPSSTTHPFEIKQAATQCLEASARQRRAFEQDQEAR